MDVTLSGLLDGTFGPFILYDLEYTAWPGSQEHGWSRPGEFQEIVQIGAVRLDPGTGTGQTLDLVEIARFEVIVRPAVNPVLSPYFMSLTGITQARLDREGLALAEALDQFAEFAGTAVIAAFGDDAGVMAGNCQMAGLALPFAAERCFDLRRPLLERIGLRGQAVSSSALPALLGLPPVGPAHDALADARAIASALAWCRRPMAAADGRVGGGRR